MSLVCTSLPTSEVVYRQLQVRWLTVALLYVALLCVSFLRPSIRPGLIDLIVDRLAKMSCLGLDLHLRLQLLCASFSLPFVCYAFRFHSRAVLVPELIWVWAFE